MKKMLTIPLIVLAITYVYGFLTPEGRDHIFAVTTIAIGAMGLVLFVAFAFTGYKELLFGVFALGGEAFIAACLLGYIDVDWYIAQYGWLLILPVGIFIVAIAFLIRKE